MLFVIVHKLLSAKKIQCIVFKFAFLIFIFHFLWVGERKDGVLIFPSDFLNFFCRQHIEKSRFSQDIKNCQIG